MTSIFIFISGATLLVYSAQKLVGHLVGATGGLRISAFLLAVIFTGIEFDDLVLGVALNVEDLQEVALGLVLGTAISLTGIVLALAAILTPTEVRVPRDYLALFAAAPLVVVVFALTAPITALDGAILLGISVLVIAYITVRELRRGIPTFRNAEVCEEMLEEDVRGEPANPGTAKSSSAATSLVETRRVSGWAELGWAVLALAGLIIGAATTSTGTEGILETYGIEGTVFGATIITAALTIEDAFLTVEPVRRGAPAIGIGNVVGSLIFSVTGKLGIIVLAGGSIVVGPDVLRWHLPVLIVLTALAAYFLSTGRLKRWHGYTLFGLYIAYWVVSFVAFGGAPVES